MWTLMPIFCFNFNFIFNLFSVVSFSIYIFLLNNFIFIIFVLFWRLQCQHSCQYFVWTLIAFLISFSVILFYFILFNLIIFHFLKKFSLILFYFILCSFILLYFSFSLFYFIFFFIFILFYYHIIVILFYLIVPCICSN